VLAECRRVLRPRGRIMVVGMSKEDRRDLMTKAFEWNHRHFPNFLDCRPIFVARALEEAGFRVVDRELKDMWVPVEVVLAAKA
jgi:ubiquinone/menaquinone biosynthesis C-methylase UbiE